MTSSAAQNTHGVGDPEAFAFVQALAAELSRGKVDLPSFPDIALQGAQGARRRGSLPGQSGARGRLGAGARRPPHADRQLRGASISPASRSPSCARAIARMGFNMVRSAAIAFAMSQLKKVDSLKGLEQPLDELWQRSAAVAAMSHAVARRFSRVNPDTAMLAGLLHGIGRLYILTRSSRHPGTLREPGGLQRHRARLARTGRQGAAGELGHGRGDRHGRERIRGLLSASTTGPPDLTDALDRRPPARRASKSTPTPWSSTCTMSPPASG